MNDFYFPIPNIFLQIVHDRIFGFGSVSVIFSGFGEYSVSADYLSDFVRNRTSIFSANMEVFVIIYENIKYFHKQKYNVPYFL